jgi:hypothetical protein
MFKQKMSLKFLNLITVVGAYMFNRYIALLPLSVFMPLCMASRIYNYIISFCNFTIDGNLSWELLLTLLLTTISILISTLIIYYIFTFIANYSIKIYQEIKDYYVKIYMDVYYPNLKSTPQIIENKNRISYWLSIELIKQSIYGIQKKHEAVTNGILKETGGNYVECFYPFRYFLTGQKFEKYNPSTEDVMESQKEEQLYDIIFQEFANSFGYYDSNNQLKYEIIYNKNSIKIERLDLEEFLRVKELALQQKLLTSKHIG